MTDRPAWVRLRYNPPPGTHTPVFILVRYWHDGSQFSIPTDDLSEIEHIPGFTVLGVADSPIPAPRRG